MSFEPVANMHDSTVTDSLVAVTYEGWTFRYWHGGGREFLTSIDVLGARTDLPLSIGINSTEAELAAFLGAPDYHYQRGDSTVIVYDIPGDQPEPRQLHFVLFAGNVRRVSWSFPVD